MNAVMNRLERTAARTVGRMHEIRLIAGIRRLRRRSKRDGLKESDIDWLHAVWGNGTWTTSPEMLKSLVGLASRSPGSIVECGCGLTTVCAALAIGNRPDTTIVALEHHETWAHIVKRRARLAGLGTVEVKHRPLVQHGDLEWYDLRESDLPRNTRLVIVDGPPGSTHGGRRGAVQVLQPILSWDVTVIVDDVDRPAERELAELWAGSADTGLNLHVFEPGDGKHYAVITAAEPDDSVSAEFGRRERDDGGSPYRTTADPTRLPVNPGTLTCVVDFGLAGLRRLLPTRWGAYVPHRRQRSRMRAVVEHQGVPVLELGSVARQTRSVMGAIIARDAPTPTIWAIGMVKDECDIVGYTVRHLLDEGIDRVLVADNGSQDGTLELLEDLAADPRLIVVRDKLVPKYQAEKVTRLARFALRAGADWVVPFDADEWWRAPGTTIGEALAATRARVVYADVYDHVPTEDDLPAVLVPNPFERMRFRVIRPSGFRKVAFRVHPIARVAYGSHDVARPGARELGLLEVRHFSVRSWEQLEHKTALNRAAYADPLAQTGGVQYRKWSKDDWRRWLTERELVEDPVVSDSGSLVTDT